MKIKKIQDKLEFDVEAQKPGGCQSDCLELRWSGETWDKIFEDEFYRGKCIGKMVYTAASCWFW